jgi:hypothetical protein
VGAAITNAPPANPVSSLDVLGHNHAEYIMNKYIFANIYQAL